MRKRIQTYTAASRRLLPGTVAVMLLNNRYTLQTFNKTSQEALIMSSGSSLIAHIYLPTPNFPKI